MPYKDPEKNRIYQRAREQKKRDEKLAHLKATHPGGPLGYEGERLIRKWVKRGAYLLRKMAAGQRRNAEKREELSIYNKKYYADNKERITEMNKQWQEAHREQHIAYKASWYRENRTRLKKAYSLYYQMNREAIKRQTRHWTQTHPVEVAGYQHAHRIRRYTNPKNDLSALQWHEILAVHKHCCAYCGKKLTSKRRQATMDHITPVSKGGEHTYANIVPSCRSCNSKKQAGPPLIQVQPLLLTVALSKKPKLPML